MDGLSWGRTPNDLAERWPKAADGTPERPAFLTNAAEADAQSGLLVNMLRAYGIPVMQRFEKDGTLGRVVLGISGYGVALYVPESMLEDARNLIAPAEAPDETETAEQ